MAVGAFGQASPVLYNPTRSIKDQGISLSGWGSGTASETDETAYEGTTSVRISSRNYFQGGIFELKNPVDVSGQYSNKNNLLRIMFKTADLGTVFSGAGKGPGLAGGPPSKGGAGGIPPGFGGPGAPGGFAGGGRPGGSTQPASTLDTLRVIVTTTDGKKSEAYVPVTGIVAGSDGWKSVAVPLQAISGLDRTNKIVKEVAISADKTSTFYIGDIRVLNDSTPISGEIQGQTQFNLALGDTVTFVASGSGGSTPVKFDWDFDDRDGIQVDAEGQTVKRRFRVPGTYNVTLTVVDPFGLKAPFSTKAKVVVNG